MEIAVVGIGQSFRGDDAAGLEAVRLWQREHFSTATRAEIRTHIVEQVGLELLELFASANAVVLVDALCAGSRPGTVRQLNLDTLDGVPTRSASGHGWGLAETLRLADLLGLQSENVKIRLIGIEPERWDIGLGLSASVRDALPQASAAIQAEIEAFLNR